MSFIHWLSSRLGRSPRPVSSRKRPASRRQFRPTLEALEGRWLPSTLTVTNNFDSGAGSLRADIAAAHNGDTIVFAPSLVGKTITLTKGELLISKNLTITGPGTSELTVSGNHTSRVFEVTTGSQVNLSGMTITNGLAVNGGGILVDAGAVLMASNSTLSGNSATSRKDVGDNGGGIDNYGTSTVTGCTVSGNSTAALGAGSAIYNHATLTVSGSTLSGNAVGPEVIYNSSDGDLTVNNSAVSGNSGSGIVNYGTVSVSGSTVSDNTGQGLFNYTGGTLMVSDSFVCRNSYYQGGGIENHGTATVSGSTLTDNSAIAALGGQGGGIWSNNKLTVTGSTLGGNTAAYGGGIEIVAGTATISGCTLSDNSAANYGGGIYIYGGTVTLSDCSLSGNSAVNYGGGIYIGVGATLTLSDSHLFGNTAGCGGGIFISGGYTNFPDATVTVENSSTITGNTAPAGFGADVYNLGVLHLDSSSIIGILDRNLPS